MIDLMISGYYSESISIDVSIVLLRIVIVGYLV